MAAARSSAWRRAAGKSITKDAKNRHGLEHICHHERKTLLVVWLLNCLTQTIERLYRMRYFHRGTHPVRAAIDLLLHLKLSLGMPAANVTGSSRELPSGTSRDSRFPDLLPGTQLLVDVSANGEKTGWESRRRLTMLLRSAVKCTLSHDPTLPYHRDSEAAGGFCAALTLARREP